MERKRRRPNPNQGSDVVIYISGPQMWTNVEYALPSGGMPAGAGVINLIHLCNVDTKVSKRLKRTDWVAILLLVNN